MADFKIGANGDLAVSLSAAGDIVLSFTDNEALSAQSVNVAIHPAVLGDGLVKILGGASWAQSLVGFLLAELEALAPKA